MVESQEMTRSDVHPRAHRRAILNFSLQMAALGALLVFYNRLTARWFIVVGAIRRGLAPLYGDPTFPPHLWPASLVAPALFVAVYLIYRLARDRSVPGWAVAATATVSALALGLSARLLQGPEGLTYRFSWTPYHYFGDVSRVQGVGHFLRHYVDLLPTLSVHSGTHPPGGVLFLWGVSRLFGPGIVAATLATTLVTALSAVPFHALARRLLGPDWALHAMPLYLATPTLVFHGASSMDGLYLFALLSAAWLYERSLSRGGVASAVGVGLALAICTLLTYATVCLIAVFCCRLALGLLRGAESRRPFFVLVVAAFTMVLSFTALYRVSGFHLLEAALWSAGRDARQMGPQFSRAPVYLLTSTTNVLAFLVGIGLPTAVLWLRQVGKPLFDAAGRPAEPARGTTDGLAAAVLVLGFSTLFTVETERVWLMLAPLAVIAAAAHLREMDRLAGRLRLVAVSYGVLAAQSVLMAWLIRA